MADGAKPGRNERCPCGSGRKFKVCCGAARPNAKNDMATPGPRPAASGGSARNLLRLAARLLDARRYAEALEPLSQAARLVPNNPAVLDDLGTACLHTGRVREAITWLRRSIALQPTVALTHYNLGVALEHSGDDEGAIAAHRRASELDPNRVGAISRMAEILRRKGRTNEAISAYEQAFAISPDTTLGRLCGASALSAQDRPKEAEALLRRLLAHDPSSHAAHVALGFLLSEAGRFDEAATHFERAIALVPREAAPYDGLVLSRRLTEADRPLVGRILLELEADDVPDPQRMTLHFAAGKALDDLRDYASAMEHFAAANRIRHRRASSLYPNSIEQRVSRLIARFTSEFFATNKAMGQDDETPILVLGMPRSGTTLTERIVTSHPKVGGGGELTFWNNRDAAWEDAATDKLAKEADRLRGDYVRLLRSIAPDALRVTDKMPFNFLHLGLVHLLLPNARIIHCRRNPIDTCLSIHFTQFTQNWEYSSDLGDLALYYRQYLRLMDHWRAVLPSDRLLEVDYEDTTAAPEATARRIIAFCGLEWDPACRQPDRNADAVKTASMWQARQPIYRSSVERWRNYEPWLGELRQLLPDPP
jgi:tetratricopeptide (TPR) repeat protein